MSVDAATQGPTALQGDTWRDREETARIAENSQLAGRFCRVWQVLGSNQRRLSRRFYRPLPLATRATCRRPSSRAASKRIAQDATRRLADGRLDRKGLTSGRRVRRDGPAPARLAWVPWHRKNLPLTSCPSSTARK